MQQGGAKNWLSQHEAEHPSHVSQAAPNCTTLQFSSSGQGPVCIGPHQGEKQKRRRGTRVAAPFCSLVLRGTANAVPGGKDKKGSQGTCCRQPAASSPRVFVPAIQGYYEDDDVSLQELIRRERIEGVQARLTLPCRSESSRVFRVPLSSLLEDYDANLEKHILKRGDRFKMLEDDEDEALGLCLVLSPLPSPPLCFPPLPSPCHSCFYICISPSFLLLCVCVCVCVGACEGLAMQAYALGWYENADKKMDSRFSPSESDGMWLDNRRIAFPTRKGAEKRLKQEKNDKNRIQAKSQTVVLQQDFCRQQVNLERCTLCMESHVLTVNVANHGLLAQLVAMR